MLMEQVLVEPLMGIIASLEPMHINRAVVGMVEMVQMAVMEVDHNTLLMAVSKCIRNFPVEVVLLTNLARRVK